MNPKTLLLASGTVGITVATSFLMFAPEDRINGVVESYRRMNRDEGQICLDYYRSFLNDPDSARLLAVERDHEGQITLVVLKTKNRMGGYVKFRRGCATIGRGVFFKPLASLHETNVVLDERIRCLAARNAIFAKGGTPDDRELNCTEAAITRKVLGE